MQMQKTVPTLTVTFMLLAATALAGMEQTLNGAALRERVVGNTIHIRAPSEDVYMYLAQGGAILSESSAHGRFVARWRLYQGDSLCFQQQDPMASGCVAVSLRGNMITFHRRDGVTEGPFELQSGNPRKL